MICFFEFLTPFTLGHCNFINSISFLMAFNEQDASIRKVQVSLKHQKQWKLPFVFGLL
jgi:hypothetical protein